MRIKSILVLSALMIYSCDDDTEDPISVDDTAVEFNIEKLDVLSLGDSDQSQPELVRFVSATEGVVVNSKQNSIDFISIDGTNLVLTGDQVQITDDPNAECSSIDVNVNETIIAVVATKGACDRGELYLVDAMTKEKYGPYELGYNPDAVDISVDDKFCLIILSAFKSRFLVSSPSELVAPLLFESSLCSGFEIIFDISIAEIESKLKIWIKLFEL